MGDVYRCADEGMQHEYLLDSDDGGEWRWYCEHCPATLTTSTPEPDPNDEDE